VTINYMQMLLDLMEERQKWIEKRDESIREISRLSELVRATMNMIPAEQIARYEPTFERIEGRPIGLSTAVRACYTGGTGFAAALRRGAEKGQLATAAAGSEDRDMERPGTEKPGVERKEWFTPVEIRDALKRMGFPFENYKANPLASIHTTLKRMVPAEMEVKTLEDGQKAYRLKSAGEWSKAFAEVRQWLSVAEASGTVIALKRNPKDQKGNADSPQDAPPKGAKRGTSGGA
jgi:hypothetical protein